MHNVFKRIIRFDDSTQKLLEDVSVTDLKPNSTSEIDKDWDDLSKPNERVLNEELELVSAFDSDNWQELSLLETHEVISIAFPPILYDSISRTSANMNLTEPFMIFISVVYIEFSHFGDKFSN